MKKEVPQSLVINCRVWLGKKGIHFFWTLFRLTKTVMPVLRLNSRRKFLPVHPVHFREGMQIRNWMREQPECASWEGHDFDDNWGDLVERAAANNGRENDERVGGSKGESDQAG